MNIALLEQLRLAQVKRYPICHTHRDQSVAEHSFGVMLIARELAKLADVNYYGLGFVAEVTEYAMNHDMDEIYTGDIPSGFKRRLRAEFPQSKIFDPEVEVSVEAKAVVKLADYLEAIHYGREFGGSRFAGRVLADIEQKFSEELAKSKAPGACIARAIELGRVI